jgi:radical SAM superfamily enzyme YgiQ (UPF0313 family)|tara:strand:- start:822 stop:2213 length:1392 start_codon:yes stop_codon:yes gene_type:complete
VNVLLISTYDLGHQPFGLASLTAWLRAEGADVVCNDTAVDALNENAVRDSGLICIHLAMHTATRLALDILPRLRALNPGAHICFFGLYGPPNADALAGFAPCSIIGGEFESEITNLYRRLSGAEAALPEKGKVVISTERLSFRTPERDGLPPLDQYAHLTLGNNDRTVGYSEASRGCKHLCRHCPVVPIYGGRFRTVPVDVVLADIGAQVANGAEHISFGDPDFFNGPGHAERIISALHNEFPKISYDVTIKVEHLLSQRGRLARLVETGCLFVTTAVESADDRTLDILDKGHSRDDFIAAAKLARDTGLVLSPTFVPFTPWTSLTGYLGLLRLISELGLVNQVSPVQLAIRLLVPEGSALLDHPEMKPHLQEFAPERLSYGWHNPDRRVDQLQSAVQALVETGEAQGQPRTGIFAGIWRLAHDALGIAAVPLPAETCAQDIPRMSEPWYCCAEPTEAQRAGL